MKRNYRVPIGIRPQGGTVFNSDQQCTEDYEPENKTVEEISHAMALDYEAWMIENLTAAEEFDEDDSQ